VQGQAQPEEQQLIGIGSPRQQSISSGRGRYQQLDNLELTDSTLRRFASTSYKGD
jgi:hypothetical protein